MFTCVKILTDTWGSWFLQRLKLPLDYFQPWQRKGSLAEQCLLTLLWWLSWEERRVLFQRQTSSTQLTGDVFLSPSRAEELCGSHFPAEEHNATVLPCQQVLPSWETKWLKGIKSLCGLWKQASGSGSHCLLSFLPCIYGERSFHCGGRGRNAPKMLSLSS